jgi:hypothetical protein
MALAISSQHLPGEEWVPSEAIQTGQVFAGLILFLYVGIILPVFRNH